MSAGFSLTSAKILISGCSSKSTAYITPSPPGKSTKRGYVLLLLSSDSALTVYAKNMNAYV